MKKYSKTRLIENIDYLLPIRKLKIGQLESKAGVSIGYFSRLKNSTNEESAPSLDALSNIALGLGVTLDTLLYYDFSELNETESFIKEFLEQMVEQTLNGELRWEKETEKFVENCRHYNNKIDPHPLMKCVWNDNGEEVIQYNSMFTDDYCQLCGDVYKLERVCQTFYVSCIVRTNNDKKNDIEYEVYLYRGDKLNKVCNASPEGKGVINSLITDLYDAAKASSSALRIDDDVKEGLESFLSGEDNKLPF